MNWIDVILLAILPFALLWGMLRGVKSQLIGLLSLFVAGVVAVLFYPDLATLLRRVLHGIPREGRETIAFLLLLIAVSNLLGYAVRSSTTPPEDRRRQSTHTPTGLGPALARGINRFVLSPLNMLGSLALAVILTCIWLGLATTVLRLSLAQPWPSYNGIRAFLYHGLQGSTVVYLLDGAFQLAYTSVYPLITGEPGSLLTNLIHRFTQLQRAL